MDIITKIYFIVGAGIVFAFAVNYFNQPSYKFADEDRNGALADQEDLMLEPALPKYLTDRFEYNLYLFAYVLATELIYVLLVLFLPDLMNSNSKETATAILPGSKPISMPWRGLTRLTIASCAAWIITPKPFLKSRPLAWGVRIPFAAAAATTV